MSHGIPNAACPLVYLPGLDGTGRLLHRQNALHEQYVVHCVRYPQHSPNSYTELARLGIDALERTGPGIVLAESFGGAVALTLALARPELVRRMVLVNTFAYFPRRPLIHLVAGVGRWFPHKPSHPITRGFRNLFFFSADIPPGERTEWWDRTADVPMSAYGDRLRMITTLDLRPRLAAVHVPTLVVFAADDRVVPPAAGRELARLLPKARLLQMRVGHAAMIHPRLDIACLLADPGYWPGVGAGMVAAGSASSFRDGNRES
jgi:pimeloyl-ACP methyl ester carboxylesterase